MEKVFEIILFGLFGFWIMLIPMILIMKIKYFKKLRNKEYRGVPELFSFQTVEFWVAGITFGFPIFGKNPDSELKPIKKNANTRLFGFYGIVLLQIIILIILIYIKD